MAHHEDAPAGAICGPGEYTHLVKAPCPFCCLHGAKTDHATRLVFDGYCAPDNICGRCGQYWSDDAGCRPMREDEREANKALVRKMKESGITVGERPMPRLPLALEWKG